MSVFADDVGVAAGSLRRTARVLGSLGVIRRGRMSGHDFILQTRADSRKGQVSGVSVASQPHDGGHGELITRVGQRVRLVRSLPSSAPLRSARYNCFTLGIAGHWVTLLRPGAGLLSVESGWRASTMASPCNSMPPALMGPCREGGIGLSIEELMVQHFVSALGLFRRSAVFAGALTQ